MNNISLNIRIYLTCFTKTYLLNLSDDLCLSIILQLQVHHSSFSRIATPFVKCYVSFQRNVFILNKVTALFQGEELIVLLSIRVVLVLVLLLHMSE